LRILDRVGNSQKGHHFGRPVGTTWAVAARVVVSSWVRPVRGLALRLRRDCEADQGRIDWRPEAVMIFLGLPMGYLGGAARRARL
jgi:hypothetical protein